MNVSLFGEHIVQPALFLTLCLTIIAIAISNVTKRKFGLGAFTISLISASYFGYVDILGILATITFGFVCYFYRYGRNRIVRVACCLAIFILSALLMLHVVPGFNNQILIDGVLVSPNAPYYTQYFNIDKAVVGFFLLIFVISAPPKLGYEAFLTAVFLSSCAFGAVIFIGSIGGAIEYDLKWPDYVLQWMLINLFITCYAEEAFFRGFIQKNVSSFLQDNKYGSLLAVLISALLFAIVHFPGGVLYMVAAFILGLAYAYSYKKTQNILVPICAHFAFNLIHFVGFTYPFVVEATHV